LTDYVRIFEVSVWSVWEYGGGIVQWITDTPPSDESQPRHQRTGSGSTALKSVAQNEIREVSALLLAVTERSGSREYW